MTTLAAAAAEPDTANLDYVSVRVAGQLFGLPIGRVREVFAVAAMTPVPLAPAFVCGLLNLRGRIVAAICLRARLGSAQPLEGPRAMAVGIETQGELYALLVDAVGDVLSLPRASFEPPPGHLEGRWSRLIGGLHRLGDELLVVLDVDAVLALDEESALAA